MILYIFLTLIHEVLRLVQTQRRTHPTVVAIQQALIALASPRGAIHRRMRVCGDVTHHERRGRFRRIARLTRRRVRRSRRMRLGSGSRARISVKRRGRRPRETLAREKRQRPLAARFAGRVLRRARRRVREARGSCAEEEVRAPLEPGPEREPLLRHTTPAPRALCAEDLSGRGPRARQDLKPSRSSRAGPGPRAPRPPP